MLDLQIVLAGAMQIQLQSTDLEMIDCLLCMVDPGPDLH